MGCGSSKTGAIALLKGTWVIELHRSGKPLPRRQDIPPKAFWTAEEVLKLWRDSAGKDQKRVLSNSSKTAGVVGNLSLFFYAISYCWCSPKHPDPDRFHLGRLASILSDMLKLRAREGGFMADCAVFWDYASLFQKPRTPQEDAHFHLALRSMHVIYAHDLVLVLKLKAMPMCPWPLDADGRYEVVGEDGPLRLAWEYERRGWPVFESSTSDTRLAVPGSRLEFGDDIRFTHKHTVRFTSGSLALHPRVFAQLLEQCAFTNGADKGAVVEMYAENFDSIRGTKRQNVQKLTLSDEMATQYAEALAEFDQLETMTVASCKVSLVGWATLLGELGQKPKLLKLHLVSTRVDDDVIELLSQHVLRSHPTIQTLSLRNGSNISNRLSAAGFTTLADALRAREASSLSSLTELSLAGLRGMTDGNLAILCEALPPSITELDLARSELTDAGAAALAALFQAHPPVGLRKLSVEGPELTKEAVALLKAALPKSCKVKQKG